MVMRLAAARCGEWAEHFSNASCSKIVINLTVILSKNLLINNVFLEIVTWYDTPVSKRAVLTSVFVGISGG